MLDIILSLFPPLAGIDAKDEPLAIPPAPSIIQQSRAALSEAIDHLRGEEVRIAAAIASHEAKIAALEIERADNARALAAFEHAAGLLFDAPDAFAQMTEEELLAGIEETAPAKRPARRKAEKVEA